MKKTLLEKILVARIKELEQLERYSRKYAKHNSETEYFEGKLHGLYEALMTIRKFANTK